MLSGSPVRWVFPAILGLACLPSAQAADGLRGLKTLEAEYRKSVAPIVEQFCLDCHDHSDASGAVSFEGIESPFALTKIWLKAADTQRQKQMPPPTRKKQPSDAERKILIDWVEKLDAVTRSVDPFDPGPAIFRRLNRLQYENTLRDLFGLDHDVAAQVGLAQDPRAYGYDTIAGALDIPESLFEKYVSAADAILDRAVDTRPAVHRFEAKTAAYRLMGAMPEGKSKDGPVPGPTDLEGAVRVFRVNTEFPLSFDAAAAGTYRVRVHGWGHKGPNWIQWRPDLLLKVGGKVLRSFPMVHTEEAPGAVDVLVDLPAGRADLTLEFSNAVHGPGWASNKDRFRTLGVERIEVSGPVPRSGVEPDAQAHKHVFFEAPGNNPREAAQKIIARFVGRAYRRPVAADEIARLMQVYDKAVEKKSNFETSVRYMLKAVLLSPHFLFRVEQDRGSGDQVYAVAGHELATRLSYFLWGTLPDEELLRAAAEGRLSDSTGLKQQVSRMLGDRRALTLVHDFSTQWLQLEMLDHALPSEENYPQFTAKARAGMRREVTLFMEHLLQENRPVTDLIDSDYTFTGRDLAPIYGFGGHQDEFKRTDIDKRRHPYRGGLLGMGAVHAMTAHVARTMPTRRGKWILDVMFGDPPPPPPANVEQIDEGADKSKAKNFRELLALHADESKTCAGCHKKTDPLGFALDNFNPIGKWETERNGRPVDASSQLPDGRKINGAVELKKLLLEQKDAFVWNLTEQLMIYALGRNVGWYDRSSIDRIVQKVKQDEGRFQTLIFEIVDSYPFRNRRNSSAKPLVAER